MRNFRLLRSIFLLMLVTSAAMAGEREERAPNERTLILSEHPRAEASRLYVGGRISTVLRFEKSCDPERTRLLGWEGHFEPLSCGGEARLSSDLTSRTARPFALRMNRTELVPGASGTLAVVADKSAFVSEQGLVDLTLEVFRSDGYQQLMVLLDHRLVRK